MAARIQYLGNDSRTTFQDNNVGNYVILMMQIKIDGNDDEGNTSDGDDDDNDDIKLLLV